MAETLNKDFAEGVESGMTSDDWKWEPAPVANFNSYVALDVANLSLLATTIPGEIDFVTSPGTPVKKALSRKESQRRGERKAPDSAFVVAAGAEKLPALIHVLEDGGEGTQRLGSTETARLAVGDGRFRRLAIRRPAPRLDPRRVLIFFATLSSVGKLILLYLNALYGKYSGRQWRRSVTSAARQPRRSILPLSSPMPNINV